MGRAKANMELIKKEKIRNNTFRDRSATLKKKIYELTTLCDVKAVMIIFGPKQGALQTDSVVPEVWPQNRDEVVELIDKYKGQSAEDRNTRTTLVSDFFKERNKKAQQELKEARKNSLQSKYPTTLDPVFNGFREEEIRNCVVYLESKIDNAKAKLEQMKANKMYRACDVQQQQLMLSKKRSMDFNAGNQANKYFKSHPHEAISEPMRLPVPMPLQIQQQRFPLPDYNQNQVMVRFVDEYGGGASNIMHNAPMCQVVYGYPRMGGSVDSINYVNNLARAPQSYYGEGMQMQPIAQHLMEYHPVPQESSSHQMAAAFHQYCEDRKWQW